VTRFKLATLVALMGFGITTLSGCVIVHHRDGGITIRPMH
jgi:hypothetical protein